MVDDMISASGMWPSHIPIWQKIFWCFTEGSTPAGAGTLTFREALSYFSRHVTSRPDSCGDFTGG